MRDPTSLYLSSGLARSRVVDGVQDPSWDPLLIFLAGFILTAVARVHLLAPFLEPLHPTLIAGVGATGLYLINLHPARSWTTIRSPATTALILFLGWMILTVPFAIREFRSVSFLANDYIKTLLLFALIVGSVRGGRDVERLAWVYLLGAAAYAVAILAFFVTGGEDWRLGDLITYDANDFALLIVTALPLGVYFLGSPGRSQAFKVVTAGALGVLGVSFVWTGSRGGFLALLAVAAFLVIRHGAIPARWRIVSAALVGLALAAVATQQFWERMASVFSPGGDYNLTSETGRLQIWKRGLGYVWDRPITGVGPDNFQVAEGVLSNMAIRVEYGMGVPWTAPHNSFLQVAAETGIPGLVIFLSFIGLLFVMLRRVEKEGGEGILKDRLDPPGLAQALMGSLLGFMVGAFFLTLAYAAMLYALAGLSVALWKVTRRTVPG